MPLGMWDGYPHKPSQISAPCYLATARPGSRHYRLGKIGRQVYSSDGIYIVRKLSEPESMRLSGNIRAKVNAEAGRRMAG